MIVRRRRTPVGFATLAALAVAVAILCSVPLLFVTWVAFDSGWAEVATLVFRPKVGELLVNTVLLLAITLPLAISLAVSFAWLVERTDLPGRGLWSWLMVAPLAVPAFVHSYAWSAFAPGFHGLWAAVAVSILAYLPFLYLPVAASLRRLDPALEETAAALGKPPMVVFFRIVLPQLRIAIWGGALLVALHLLAEYGLFVLTRYDTFATAIVDQFQSVYNGPAANLLGGVLVVACLVLLRAESALRGDERYARIGSGSIRRAERQSLGPLRWGAMGLVLIFTLFSLGVPLWTLSRWLWLGGAAIWRLDAVLPALGQTAALALGAALLTTIAAFPIAWLSVRAPSRSQRLLEAAHYYVGALPGVIVALALVTITVRLAPSLYQTMATLVIAYMLMFLPRAVVGLRSSIAQAPPELERAASSLGKRPMVAIARTTLRLAMPGATASTAMVALGIANELTATLMLAPNGTRTLAMRFWAYTAELDFSSAAPYALLMIVLSLPLVVLLRFESRKIGQI